MVKQPSIPPLLIAAFFVLLALAIWLLFMRDFRLDDSFITYRYARNLARGWGLVYNQGEVVLSTTAPLYAALLAVLSFVLRDFHLLGGLVGSISIGLGGGLIMEMLPRRMPLMLRGWAGLLYVLNAALWLSLGMETALWLMLVLAALWLAQRNQWRESGLVMGLAILVRPDAALPATLLALIALGASLNQLSTRGLWWRPIVYFGLFAAAPPLIFGLLAWATYGIPLPITLGAKSAQATLGITGLGTFVSTLDGLLLVVQGLMAHSSLYITFILLALFGLASRLNWQMTLIVVWGVLHLLVYTLLGVAPYRWYYTPLVPGVVLLMANGLNYISRRLARHTIPAATLVVGAITIIALVPQLISLNLIALTIQQGSPAQAMLPVVDWQVYREVGEWLREHTPGDATVGVAEVGQVGFYADRWMTDYLGLLQPAVSAALKRGDLYSWLPMYAPDYLVFQRFRGAPLVLYNYRIDGDPWFVASYQSVIEFDDARYAYGPVTIFQLVSEQRPLVEQSALLAFGPLQLVGMATDGNDLSEQGGPVRVRLDWQVNGTLPPRLHIAVACLDVPDAPIFDREYNTQNWVGNFSTWHTLVLPPDLAPRGYRLLITVGAVGEADYASQTVGWLDVSFPKEEQPESGTQFTRNGEPQLRLVASDIEVLPDNRLALDMTWFAEQNLAADYTHFVHVTPEESSEVLAQSDGQPLDGQYPTHLWQAGERIPMQVTVEALPATEGRYQVILGWYLQGENSRLLRPNGGDSLLIGRLVVTANGGVIITPVSQ